MVKESDIIFITTPDDEILNLWKSINKFDLENKIICHTSGSLSSNIFKNSQKACVNSISLHPMFPIADKYESYKNMRNAYFTAEGDEVAVLVFEKIFKRLKNKLLKISWENKKLYHLANVTASNLYLALIKNSIDYLNICGIDEATSVKALFPLIEANINNVFNNGIVNALTGPVERADINTIIGHLEVIPSSDILVYAELSKKLLSIAKDKNEKRDYSKLKELLEEIR